MHIYEHKNAIYIYIHKIYIHSCISAKPNGTNVSLLRYGNIIDHDKQLFLKFKF